ncbi:hypothetical protein THIX_60067 [Thiomonas sp. X19]|nr:hypothetical protein THIX_60067 [Thiomonas sp. X19]
MPSSSARRCRVRGASWIAFAAGRLEWSRPAQVAVQLPAVVFNRLGELQADACNCVVADSAKS